MKETGYLLLRITMGVNFLFHAINRFYYGHSNFIDWMVTEFEPTFIPVFAIKAFAFVLPILEALAGISLLVGLKTKWGLIIGASIIVFLVSGSCLIHKWDWVGLQMVYALCFYLLFEKMDQNKYSLDYKKILK